MNQTLDDYGEQQEYNKRLNKLVHKRRANEAKLKEEKEHDYGIDSKGRRYDF
jgi:hypothetical protein